ncbi:PilT/PilU family type 4a pilus ATPase [Deinococcus deserti]|uniref:Putative Twitching mobility protein n=1 Tax=Deinococcus deserti (strain DSM 17065 / CIP 109153 / LMG 22923 / VCD115) TaxID=546414 RepID=C1D1A3_DEIDV|nr:PilT/PilU family type 4a pilus ATPase [Deinococcus deserti]ACO45627.1 putative Twitching mobility protein [Deinococcus deserti VCD115]
MTLEELLRELLAHRASDIHLQAGSPPMGRIDGALVPFGSEPLMPPDTEALAQTILNSEQWEDFEYRQEFDTSYTAPGLGRFRCNVFRQRGAVGVVMRVVSDAVPGFETLGLPADVMRHFSDAPRGLVLVTGPTGSGKSTTLASLIDHINRTYAYNIITIEDPIEILHRNKRSLVVQREVGNDTRDFRTALKYAMRQDPDVIMIGEMRDRETVDAALSAAQTGHLVLSTLHTQDSVRTVNRIIEFFAPHEREQVRLQLAESLIGIVSQRLLRRADGVGRVLASEILLNTPLIQDYIRDEDRTPLIKDALMEDNIRGMHTFDQHLMELYQHNLITLEEATDAATSPHELKLMVTRSGFAS